MSSGVFLLVAVGLGLVGWLALWLRHRPSRDVYSSIDVFSKEMKALAPRERVGDRSADRSGDRSADQGAPRSKKSPSAPQAMPATPSPPRDRQPRGGPPSDR